MPELCQWVINLNYLAARLRQIYSKPAARFICMVKTHCRNLAVVCGRAAANLPQIRHWLCHKAFFLVWADIWNYFRTMSEGRCQTKSLYSLLFSQSVSYIYLSFDDVALSNDVSSLSVHSSCTLSFTSSKLDSASNSLSLFCTVFLCLYFF